jgi:hypothetical protein
MANCLRLAAIVPTLHVPSAPLWQEQNDGPFLAD